MSVKLRKYKNPLILLALAIGIVAFRAAIVVTALYWVFIAGIVIALLVFWLRWRNTKGHRPRQTHYNDTSRNSNPRGYKNLGGHKKKAANVIPFKKKRDSK